MAVIPARGGSKGLPRKNLRVVGGRPMLAWSIAAARESKYLDRTILSSDDEEIIRAAKHFGCDVPFVRPADLSRDDTPGVEPILHALRRLPGYAYVVVLQPTSPLRTGEDIDRALDLCVQTAAPACVSVTKVDQHPEWMYRLEPGGRLQPLLGRWKTVVRRQDLAPVYSLNGAVYVARTDWLLESKTFLVDGTVAYVMPRARSVDIDTESDLQEVEAIMREAMT